MYIEIVKDSGVFEPWVGNSDNEGIVEIGGVGSASIIQLTSDGDIKASAGTLFSVFVSGDGVTVGDTLEIKDGAAGSTYITFVFDATDQTFPLWTGGPIGAAFATGIYADFTLAVGGTIYMTAVYA